MDPYRLDRFVEAQAAVYAEVVAELRSGRKRSHWMWFIFPQIAGLGHSATARHFAIASLAEARAYLAHPTLGPRLQSCTDCVLQIENRTAQTIFGAPDDMKFRSSMTLFAHADPVDPRYKEALATYFGGQEDALTLKLLG